MNVYDEARSALADYHRHLPPEVEMPAYMVHKLAATLESVLEVTSGNETADSANAPDNVVAFPQSWYMTPLELDTRGVVASVNHPLAVHETPYAEVRQHIPGVDTRTHWANGKERLSTPEAYIASRVAQQAEIERLARIGNKIPPSIS